ncbi:MAG: GNAT family N-acetyltransferase [Sphingomonadales bacterium]|jgi:putative acetyltransferase|nr:GNAT family N-acetyltransferase [Sphingomonadales bacterium]MBK9004669.1 GNAT family N-acetyltransferase [Sphingomonadales bacterium]MBK9269851.1 GNAT family N-acetyltransferase [Sphingomonadales bacterium]MBP6433687.1 GNAT family N-acetyltransferase [Sphingorhabdus sp.]
MHIIEDDLSGPEIRALLEEHFAHMLANSPKDSCHFLDFEGLKGPGVTFWSVWTDAGPKAELMGCGALREIDPAHGEIKSMRTHSAHLRKGAGAAMLEHIIATARACGYRRLSLETGSGPAFDAAHGLYLRHGFDYCTPFGDYVEDPFSRFMTLAL